MRHYFVNNNSERLLIFFMGWGMDELAMKDYFSNEKDILFLYDYTDLDFNFDFSKYKEFELLTFSAGVFISTLLKNKLPNFSHKTAVNGLYTLNIGESLTIINKVKTDNLTEFRLNYLFETKEEMIEYLSNGSNRTWESCLSELASLIELSSKHNLEKWDFDKIYISKHDGIIDPEIQKKYWESGYTIIEGKHCPFYNKKNSCFDIYRREKASSEVL